MELSKQIEFMEWLLEDAVEEDYTRRVKAVLRTLDSVREKEESPVARDLEEEREAQAFKEGNQ